MLLDRLTARDNYAIIHPRAKATSTSLYTDIGYIVD